MGVGDINTILGLSMKDGLFCHDTCYHGYFSTSDEWPGGWDRILLKKHNNLEVTILHFPSRTIPMISAEYHLAELNNEHHHRLASWICTDAFKNTTQFERLYVDLRSGCRCRLAIANMVKEEVTRQRHASKSKI